MELPVFRAFAGLSARDLTLKAESFRNLRPVALASYSWLREETSLAGSVSTFSSMAGGLLLSRGQACCPQLASVLTPRCRRLRGWPGITCTYGPYVCVSMVLSDNPSPAALQYTGIAGAHERPLLVGGWTVRCGLGSVSGRKKKRRNQQRPSRNLVDTTMAWGDIMTLTATQLVRAQLATRSDKKKLCCRFAGS